MNVKQNINLQHNITNFPQVRSAQTYFYFYTYLSFRPRFYSTEKEDEPNTKVWKVDQRCFSTSNMKLSVKAYNIIRPILQPIDKDKK